MSTRGVIAKTTDMGFQGVYNHSDSQPRFLGRRRSLVESDGLEAWVKEWVESHPCGWSVFPDRCYCHDSMQDEPEMIITQDNVDWLFTEWAYIVDKESMTLSLLAGRVQEPGMNYGSRLVESFPLSGTEPSWKDVEKQAGRIRDRAEAAAERRNASQQLVR